MFELTPGCFRVPVATATPNSPRWKVPRRRRRDFDQRTLTLPRGDEEGGPLPLDVPRRSGLFRRSARSASRTRSRRISTAATSSPASPNRATAPSSATGRSMRRDGRRRVELRATAELSVPVRDWLAGGAGARARAHARRRSAVHRAGPAHVRGVRCASRRAGREFRSFWQRRTTSSSRSRRRAWTSRSGCSPASIRRNCSASRVRNSGHGQRASPALS